MIVFHRMQFAAYSDRNGSVTVGINGKVFIRNSVGVIFGHFGHRFAAAVGGNIRVVDKDSGFSADVTMVKMQCHLKTSVKFFYFFLAFGVDVWYSYMVGIHVLIIFYQLIP